MAFVSFVVYLLRNERCNHGYQNSFGASIVVIVAENSGSMLPTNVVVVESRGCQK